VADEDLDALLEDLMQDAVRDGIVEDTGQFTIGENGKPLKVYRSLIYGKPTR
jgi:hypothetical protein